MRVIKAHQHRKRYTYVKRPTKGIKVQSTRVKKYEEFEDITNGSGDHLSDVILLGSSSEVSSTASPRNAFDIVSEYLNHPPNCEDPYMSLGQNIPRFSSKNSSASKLNKDDAPNSLGFYSRNCLETTSSPALSNARQNALNGQRCSQAASKSLKGSGSNLKSVEPLSEVSTNVDYQPLDKNRQVVCEESEKVSSLDNVSVKSEKRSLPILENLLMNGQDPALPNTKKLCKPLEQTNTSLTPNTENHNTSTRVRSPQDVTKVAPKDRVPIVLVSVTPQFEPVSIITSSACPTASELRLSTSFPSCSGVACDSMGSLSDVHTLIRSTAVAGSDLVDNNGLSNPSMISHLSALVHPKAVKRSSSRRAGSIGHSRNRRTASRRLTNGLSPVTPQMAASVGSKTNTMRTRHPFMHFWESEDDQVAIHRGWRSRRRAFLSLSLSYPDTEQSTMVVDGGRQARRRTDYAGLFQVQGKSGVYSRLDLNDKSPALAAEWNAQSQMLAQLEPVILGYRWPESNETSNETNREVMLMWN